MSHQWLSQCAPDPSNEHYESMKSAVEQIAAHFQAHASRLYLRSRPLQRPFLRPGALRAI